MFESVCKILEFASVCFLEVLKNEVTAETPVRVRVRTRTFTPRRIELEAKDVTAGSLLLPEGYSGRIRATFFPLKNIK